MILRVDADFKAIIQKSDNTDLKTEIQTLKRTDRNGPPAFCFLNFISRNLFFRIFRNSNLCRDLFSLVFLPEGNKTGYTEVQAVCKTRKVCNVCRAYRVRKVCKARKGRKFCKGDRRRKDDFPDNDIRRNEKALPKSIF